MRAIIRVIIADISDEEALKAKGQIEEALMGIKDKDIELNLSNR